MMTANLIVPTGYAVKETPAKEAEGMLALVMRAIESPQFDVAKLEAVLKFKREVEADIARQQYVAAMAAFKRDVPKIAKNNQVRYRTRDGDLIEYKHATLDAITEVVNPGLAANGLAYHWETAQLDKGLIRVTCVMRHVGGHQERSTPLEAMPDNSGKKNAIQQVGSTVSYLQRYTLLGALGMSTGGDDDGRGGKPDENGNGEVETDDPWTPEIKEAALAAVNGGVAGFKKWWQEQSEEFRSASRTTTTFADMYAKAQEFGR